MDYCTRKLLDLTDENYSSKKMVFALILSMPNLAIYQAIIVDVVSKMKGKSSKTVHIEQKSN
jgi:hypothetical protein